MKKFISLIIIMLVLIININIEIQASSKTNPRYLEEYDYEQISESFFSHYRINTNIGNGDSQPDSHTESVSLEKSAEASFSFQATAGAIVAKATYGLEVKFGTSYTYTESHTWGI